MLILAVKVLHILAAVLFLGAGLMTAFYKYRADRSGDLRVIVWCQKEIVRADWYFTVPSALFLPISGLWLMVQYQLSLRETRWIQIGLAGWVTTGLLWLPAAYLQIKMRALAAKALQEKTELPPEFHRANAIWLALGVPAFAIAMFVVWMMVTKGAT